MKLTDIKELVKLENRNYDELNIMANRIIDESILSLLDKHVNGTKTEQLSAFTALVKRFPEYKVFCYPETFLRDNELYICKENCDFVRRSAFYDMVNNYEEIKDYCNINPEEIDTALIFVENPNGKMIQPNKDEIDEIRQTFKCFNEYVNDLKIEIALSHQN